MTATQITITIIVLIVIAALGYGIWFVTRRRALQNRFGPEYDRAVAEGDSRLAAERELRERERRHAELELRDLDPEARARYTSKWEDIQARFLDDPAGAVRDADALVTDLIAERGYPTGDYEDHVARLSVEHARTLGHYRDAHEISQLSERGEATTEQLRQAVVHYRTLFADLLGTDPTPGRTTSEASPADATLADGASSADNARFADGAASADGLKAATGGMPAWAAADGVPSRSAAVDEDAAPARDLDRAEAADERAGDDIPAPRAESDVPHHTRRRS